MLKRPYRLARLRYIGLARNTAAVILAFLAMNLRRALVLLREESVSSPA
jgi:IS5 family transposase